MSIAKQVETLQKWCEDNYPQYKKLRDDFKDAEKLEAVLSVQLPSAVATLLEYDPKVHGSDFAVAACVETRIRLSAILKAFHFVEHYEEQREQLDNFLKMNDDQKKDSTDLDPDPGNEDGSI